MYNHTSLVTSRLTQHSATHTNNVPYAYVSTDNPLKEDLN